MTSSTSPAELPLLYRILRAVLFVYGLLFFIPALLELVYPAILYSETDGLPPLVTRVFNALLFSCIGVFFVLPFGKEISQRTYVLRLLLSLFITGFCVYVAIKGFAGFSTGAKSWHVVPVSFLVISIGIALPLTFVWSRYLNQENKTK